MGGAQYTAHHARDSRCLSGFLRHSDFRRIRELWQRTRVVFLARVLAIIHFGDPSAASEQFSMLFLHPSPHRALPSATAYSENSSRFRLLSASSFSPCEARHRTSTQFASMPAPLSPSQRRRPMTWAPQSRPPVLLLASTAAISHSMELPGCLLWESFTSRAILARNGKKSF